MAGEKAETSKKEKMPKCEAYWELDSIISSLRSQLTEKQKEAIRTAQDLLEADDILSEMLEKGELIRVVQNGGQT